MSTSELFTLKATHENAKNQMFMNQVATTELEYINQQKIRAKKIATQCDNLIASLTLFQTAVEKYNAELRTCISQKELLQRHARFNFSSLDDEEEFKVHFYTQLPDFSRYHQCFVQF